MAEPNIRHALVTWRDRVIRARAIVAKPWRQYRAAVFQGYLVLAIVFFAGLAALAHSVAYFTFDVTIARDMQTINAAWFDILMRSVSWLGFAPQVDVVAACLLLFLYLTGLRWEAVMGFVAATVASIGGSLIKILIERPRPSPDLVHVLTQLHDYSFPSGHVLFYTSFFGFLMFLAYTLLKRSVARSLLLVLFGGLIALVGPSRVYEGEHWPSDVLAAYLLSSVWLFMVVYLYRWGKSRYFVNQPVAKEMGTDRPVSSS